MFHLMPGQWQHSLRNKTADLSIQKKVSLTELSLKLHLLLLILSRVTVKAGCGNTHCCQKRDMLHCAKSKQIQLQKYNTQEKVGERHGLVFSHTTQSFTPVLSHILLQKQLPQSLKLHSFNRWRMSRSWWPRQMTKRIYSFIYCQTAAKETLECCLLLRGCKISQNSRHRK